MARIEPVFSGATIEIENPYQPSSSQLIEDEVTSFSKPKIFDFSGRISLARYWLIHIPFVVAIPTVVLAFFIIGLLHQPLVLIVVAVTVLIPSVLLSISLLMRRARDLGWSPAWGVLAIVLPGIGTFIWLLLVTLPGRNKTNKYGSPNPSLSTLAKTLTFLLVVFTLVGLTALLAYFPDFRSAVTYEWLFDSLSATQI